MNDRRELNNKKGNKDRKEDVGQEVNISRKVDRHGEGRQTRRRRGHNRRERERGRVGKGRGDMAISFDQ